MKKQNMLAICDALSGVQSAILDTFQQAEQNEMDPHEIITLMKNYISTNNLMEGLYRNGR